MILISLNILQNETFDLFISPALRDNTQPLDEMKDIHTHTTKTTLITELNTKSSCNLFIEFELGHGFLHIEPNTHKTSDKWRWWLLLLWCCCVLDEIRFIHIWIWIEERREQPTTLCQWKSIEIMCWPNLPVEIKSNQLILLQANIIQTLEIEWQFSRRRWWRRGRAIYEWTKHYYYLSMQTVLQVYRINDELSWVCMGVQIRREERARVPDIIIHEVNRNNNLNLELVRAREGECVYSKVFFHRYLAIPS